MQDEIKKDSKNFDWSFQKGYSLIKMKDRYIVMSAIMGVLGITSSMGWHNRLIGLVEPKASEMIKIENIFKLYGVAKRNVWGKMEEKEAVQQS